MNGWGLMFPMLLKSDPKGNKPVKGYSLISTKVPSKPEICEALTKGSTDGAIDFIQRHKDQPFFLYIPYNMPHLGLHASKDFVGKSRRGPLGDVMEEIDFSVGRIRDAIEQAGITKNTLIIFSSDNGPWNKFRTINKSHYGDTRLQVGYAQPFRDGKGSNWEGGHRVPGIFCWPSKIKAHSTELSPVSTLDILPTIFALAGVDLPKDRSIDGRDIRSYLMPDDFSNKLPEFEFYYSHSKNQPQALRLGPWKILVRISSQTGNNYGFTASRDKPLLFHLEHDLSERIDRASEEQNIVKKMKNKLTTFENQLQKEGSFWSKSK